MYQVSVHACGHQVEGDNDGIRHARLIVRVTDSNGNPVKGIAQRDFTIYSDKGGYFGEESIRFFDECNATFPATHLPGVYYIDTNWVHAYRGSFIFAVAVRHRDGDTLQTGQGLATLIKQVGNHDA